MSVQPLYTIIIGEFLNLRVQSDNYIPFGYSSRHAVPLFLINENYYNYKKENDHSSILTPSSLFAIARMLPPNRFQPTPSQT